MRWMISIAVLIAFGCGAPQPRVSERPPFPNDTCPPFPLDCYVGHNPAADDGCPDPPPLRFAFERDSLEIIERRHSWLEDIERRRPGLTDGVRLRVTGHAAPGEEQRLALRRARVVARALIARGVDEGRLDVSEAAPEATGGVDQDAMVDVTVIATGCADE